MRTRTAVNPHVLMHHTVCLAPSTLRFRQRCARDGPHAPRMGLHPLHQPQRPVHPPRRVHRERLALVRITISPLSSSANCTRPSPFRFASYRSYRGYNYDPAYTSHAHGWSSGPTSALTYYVLGLTVTSPQGATWALAPHPTGLPAAEGGFSTPFGWFGANWREAGGAFTMGVDVPAGTNGVVRVPSGVRGMVRVDGRAVGGVGEVWVQGGKHTIVVS